MDFQETSKSVNEERSQQKEDPLALIESIQFHKFPKLPIEIRLEIWQCSFPNGCHVQLRKDRWHPRSGSIWTIDRQWCLPNQKGYTEPTPTYDQHCGPVTLRVCKEARKETLRHYITLFEDEPIYPTIYFSPLQDVLNFEKCSERFSRDLQGLTCKTKEQLSLVRQLSFEVYKLYDEHLMQDTHHEAFWACFKRVDGLILTDIVTNFFWNDIAEVQETLRFCRTRLDNLRKSPTCKINAIKTISFLTYQSVLHESQNTESER
ncbi:hypothetical protein L207DRAFT_577396 [Hyaloscypha variabilis F]|uniref:2EXR domain-containing protein n=1 Tax=Hyaloscypha variabilis (strain UAMH 11265 / GT02V1 / F) TaxID=1149755 RepID=A0A2J6S718_HYAVF|nr:hypothetical protein L207DRAFT_577396 [Hyaloscypha variabilis F]